MSIGKSWKPYRFIYKDQSFVGHQAMLTQGQPLGDQAKNRNNSFKKRKETKDATNYTVHKKQT